LLNPEVQLFQNFASNKFRIILVLRQLLYPLTCCKDFFHAQFYKHCSRWQEQVDDLPQGGLREKIELLRGAQFADVLSRVAARLGLNQISQGE
jgi:hypothetical protein